MRTRNITKEDYLPIISVLNDWWGGRNMTEMLPKLFFEHFNHTSFVVEKDGEILAFLVGFLSQTSEDEAYIHFVGVKPAMRKEGLGKKLYNLFFETIRAQGRTVVKCITSPVNSKSITFHQAMGFNIVESETLINGVFVHTNYDGKGNDRVLFYKELD